MEKTDTAVNTRFNKVSYHPVWGWYKLACCTMKKRPLMIIASHAIVFGLLILISIASIIGQYVAIAIYPVIFVGLLYLIEATQKDSDQFTEPFLAGLRHCSFRLVFSGILYFILSIIITAFFTVFFIALSLDSIPDEATQVAQSITDWQKVQYILSHIHPTRASWLFLLFGIFCLTALTLAFYFSPYLIYFKKLSIYQSYRISLSCCLKNIIAISWYLTLATLLCILSFMTLGLGFLITLPIMTASYFQCCSDMFTVTD